MTAEQESARVRPDKGTPEYDLWIAAIEIAAAPPLRQGQHVWAAQVPWSLVDRLRKALGELGLDWESVKAANIAAGQARSDGGNPRRAG